MANWCALLINWEHAPSSQDRRIDPQAEAENHGLPPSFAEVLRR
jgi:hypothetical protein